MGKWDKYQETNDEALDLIMSQVITLTSALMDISANSQRQLYRIFARNLANTLNINELQLHTHLASLKGNESAYIGGGVMILHGWVPMIDEPVLTFARLKSPMDNVALVDKKPCDLVLLLLSPKSDGPVHLSRLSRISRIMRDDHVCDMLRGATSDSAVEAIFLNELRTILNKNAA